MKLACIIFITYWYIIYKNSWFENIAITYYLFTTFCLTYNEIYYFSKFLTWIIFYSSFRKPHWKNNSTTIDNSKIVYYSERYWFTINNKRIMPKRNAFLLCFSVCWTTISKIIIMDVIFFTDALKQCSLWKKNKIFSFRLDLNTSFLYHFDLFAPFSLIWIEFRY